MPTPTDFSFIISVAISGLSHFVRGNKLPRWLNTLIALTAILLIGAVVVWISPEMPSDFKGWVVRIALIAASLITGSKEIADLLQYLKEAEPFGRKESTERQVRASVQDWTSRFREDG